MKLYLKFIKTQINNRLAYRADFIFTLISIFVWSLASPLFIFLLYGAGATYPDWTIGGLLIFLGCFTIITGFGRTIFFVLFFNIQRRVREGKLETVLIKPMDELQYLIYDSFEFEGIAELITGIVLLVIGISMTTLNVNYLLLIIYFIGAIMLYASFIIFISTLAIRFVKVHRLMEILNNVFEIASYPKNLYPRTIQLGMSIFIPLFILSYYPASAILGIETQNNLIILISVLVLFFASIIFFKKTIKYYTGAGG
ncbi:MAG: ABC transporter permease [Candidatus Woesearchaeota archaeon]